MPIEDKQLNVKNRKTRAKRGGKLDPLQAQQEKDLCILSVGIYG